MAETLKNFLKCSENLENPCNKYSLKQEKNKIFNETTSSVLSLLMIRYVFYVKDHTFRKT